MIKGTTFLLLLSFHLISETAKAQSYNVESLDRTEENINLYCEPNGILAISHLQDTLLINDFMSVDTIEVLSQVFLKITYAKRAGSNEDFANQLLLCVSNGRLCQALHIDALTTYDMRPKEYSLFR
jgi:hypothetical protein